jgi:hypothetical protein
MAMEFEARLAAFCAPAAAAFFSPSRVSLLFPLVSRAQAELSGFIPAGCESHPYLGNEWRIR